MTQAIGLNPTINTLPPAQEKPCLDALFERIQAIWNAICAWISSLAERLFPPEVLKQLTIADSSPDSFRLVMRYLYPEEVARCEPVCKSWKANIIEKVWEMQCQQEGVELEENYKCKAGQYKEAFKTPEPIRAFGATEWKQYFGDPGVAPRLPVSIYRTFKKLEVTHTLTLIPATVNGKPLTLNTFASFTPVRTMELRMVPGIRKTLGDEPVEKSLWVWLQKDFVPETGGKSQEEAEKSYRLGKTLWIVVSIFAHYTRWDQRPLDSDDFIAMMQEKNPESGAPAAVSCSDDGVLVFFATKNHADTRVANAFPA